MNGRPPLRLDRLGAERLLDCALDTHAAGSPGAPRPAAPLQIRLRVRVVEPTVVLVISVNLLWSCPECRSGTQSHRRTGSTPQTVNRRHIVLSLLLDGPQTAHV